MLNIQKFINESTNQRSQIWRDYDSAVASRKELINKFNQQFDSSGTVNAIKPLTPQNLPPEEVLAVITNLKQTERHIAQAKSNVQQDANEIEKLKIKARNLIITLSALGFVLLGGLIIYVKAESQNNNESSQSSIIDIWVASSKTNV